MASSRREDMRSSEPTKLGVRDELIVRNSMDSPPVIVGVPSAARREMDSFSNECGKLSSLITPWKSEKCNSSSVAELPIADTSTKFGADVKCKEFIINRGPMVFSDEHPFTVTFPKL